MNSETQNKTFGLDRGNLKMIALFCMALDHSGIAFLDPLMMRVIPGTYQSFLLSCAYYFLRLVGRLAFPIFCFFVVEGLKYTRSVFKYGLRMAFLAIVSEIPFDLVAKHKVFCWQSQNVFLTLLIGLIVIYNIDGIRKKFKINFVVKKIFIFFVALAGIIISEDLYTDYGSIGVLTIVAIYLLGEKEYALTIIINIIAQFIRYGVDSYKYMPFMLFMMFLITGTAFLFVCLLIRDDNCRKMYGAGVVLTSFNVLEISALVNVALIKLYNGQKGRKIGWLFYIFYPAHLALYAGLMKLFGLF